MKIGSQNKPVVSLFFRKPKEAHFSVERLFRDVISVLPSDLTYKTATSTFDSRGLFRRIFNMVEAFFRQSNVNHITGDVHYLSYFLPKNNTLLTILDCGPLERLKGFKKFLFCLLWYRLPVKKVSLITVISESTKRELLRYVKCDDGKIRVIPCCISDKFHPVPHEFNKIMPVFLQIGTGYNKNIQKVAEALSDIPCHMRIIGKLSEEQISQLSACKINYSSVSNLSDAEIIDEYINCDALIFVSTYEGFGMPIVEANATGRPVLTSKILSMPEVAGNAACLVDPFDAQDIKNGILKIILDDSYRNLLIANGYVNAHRFSSKVVAAQYAAVYKEILTSNAV